MRLSQRFDDLGEFVAAYRGRISREGLVLDSDTLYQEGTVLVIDIGLSDSLALIRGTAGVVQLMREPSEAGSRYRIVLEFLQLDDESEAFLRRLSDTFEAEDVELFRLDRYVEKGRRGIRRPPSGSFSAVGSPPPVIDQSSRRESRETDPDLREAPIGSESVASRGGRGRRRWLALTLVAALAAAGAATGIAMKLASFAGRIPVIDPLPVTAATAVGPESRLIPAHSGRGRQPTEVPDSSPRPPPAPAVAEATTGPARHVQEVTWHDADEFTVVTVLADDVIQESEVRYFRMESGPRPRMVLYLYGFGPSDLDYRTDVDGQHLSAIRVWYHGDRSPVQLHIVLDLAGGQVMAYKPIVEGRRLLVTLGPRG